MTATHDVNPTIPTTPVLYLSLELGQKNWKLAFTVGLGQKPRLRTIAARDTEALMAEIAAAKKRFSGTRNGDSVGSSWDAGLRAAGCARSPAAPPSGRPSRRRRRAGPGPGSGAAASARGHSVAH